MTVSVRIGSASCAGCVIAPQVVVIELETSGGKMCQSSAKNWIRMMPRKNDGIEYSVRLIADDV